MAVTRYFCPAKINLYLAVTGRRSDGFHELVSVVAPLDWGDQLTVTATESRDPEFTLECDDPGVPTGEDNLILRAARAFAAATGWRCGAHFALTKVVPMGAGLGGGSSDAAAALRGLNDLAGRPLDGAALGAVAAEVGSDCPLFLRAGPVVMRGRGEVLETLDGAVRARLEGQRLLVFKPAFGINTVWAYRRLASEAPASYLAPAQAEARWRAWRDDPSAPLAALGFNSLERPAFGKFVTLPVMIASLQQRFGLQARMSGSGSACYAPLPDDADLGALRSAIQADWGESSMVQVVRIGAVSARNPD